MPNSAAASCQSGSSVPLPEALALPEASGAQLALAALPLAVLPAGAAPSSSLLLPAHMGPSILPRRASAAGVERCFTNTCTQGGEDPWQPPPAPSTSGATSSGVRLHSPSSPV